jgi:hypothetical protein
VRFSVEQWAPEYGSALETADDAPTADVAVEMEARADDWAPRATELAPPARLAFVDGVTRIDAQLWIIEDGGAPAPGICATYAAGVARCDARAVVDDVRVGRTLFSPAASALPIHTKHGTYEVSHWAGDVESLAGAAVDRMRALEADVARAAASADLIVLDGLLWGRADIVNAIGYVKSHRTVYLPDEQHAVVAALGPGQRTPVFLITTTWSRFSWYMRLPGGDGHPWAGIVRCEASPDLRVPAVARLADLACAALPRYASSSHRDPRAPQNLYPIAGLEDVLRHRMGNAELLHRSLRAAAAP